jgi:hypothetical protein
MAMDEFSFNGNNLNDLETEKVNKAIPSTAFRF